MGSMRPATRSVAWPGLRHLQVATLLALLAAACLLGGAHAQSDTILARVIDTSSLKTIIGSDVKLTDDPNTRGTNIFYIAPSDSMDLTVYADTITILGPSGLLSKRGADGTAAGQTGTNGRNIKLVSRRLACTAGLRKCIVETTGGSGKDWGGSQAAEGGSAGASGANGQDAGSGGNAGKIELFIDSMDSNIELKADGGAGGKGQIGGNGRSGNNGADAKNVQCNGNECWLHAWSWNDCKQSNIPNDCNWQSVIYSGQKGGNAQAGGNAGNNGRNGAGGNAGNIIVRAFSASSPNPSTNVLGGAGGYQASRGAVGSAGRAGYGGCYAIRRIDNVYNCWWSCSYDWTFHWTAGETATGSCACLPFICRAKGDDGASASSGTLGTRHPQQPSGASATTSVLRGPDQFAVAGQIPSDHFVLNINAAKRSWQRKDSPTALSQLRFLKAAGASCNGMTCAALLAQVDRLIAVIESGASATYDSFGSSIITLNSDRTRCLESFGSSSPPSLTLTTNCTDENLPRQLFTLASDGKLKHEQSQLHLYVASDNTTRLGNLSTLDLKDSQAGLWYVDVTGTLRPRHLPDACLEAAGTSLKIQPIDHAGTTDAQMFSVVDKGFVKSTAPVVDTAKFLLASTANPRGQCLTRSTTNSSVSAPFCLSLAPGDVQELSYDRNSRLKSSTGLCLTTDTAKRDGSDSLFLANCTPDMAGQVWINDTLGMLHAAHFSAGLCLKASGTRIVIASCAPSVATAWAARPTCDVSATTWNLVRSEVCTRDNGFISGCPFSQNTWLGVCGDQTSVVHRPGAFISKLEAYLALDGDAIGALRLSFSDDSPAEVVGDSSLLLDDPQSATLMVDSPVAELRMWYSRGLDRLDRLRIGRLYMRLRDDPSKILDLGSKERYASNNPDLSLSFYATPTKPSALGVLFGVYFTHAAPRQGQPLAFNTIGFLLPKTPTETAYTIELPDITEQMIQQQPLSAMVQVVDNSKSDRPTDALCPAWEQSVSIGRRYTRTKAEAEMETRLNKAGGKASVKKALDLKLVGKLEVTVEGSYEYTWGTTKTTTTSETFEDSNVVTTAIKMPSQKFYLGPWEIGTCTGVYAQAVLDLEYSSSIVMNFADGAIYKRSWSGTYSNVNTTSGFTSFKRVVTERKSPPPPPAPPPAPPPYARPVATGQFIRNITLLTGNGKPSMCPRAFTWVEHNLNGPGEPGVGSPLYACYLAGRPVDFPSSRFIADVTIAAGPVDDDATCPSGFTRLPTDLNAGTEGWYVYMCVQYIPSPYGQMLEDIEVSETYSCRPGFTLASSQNLNQGVASATPLFLCKRLADSGIQPPTVSSPPPPTPPPPPPMSFYQTIPNDKDVCVFYTFKEAATAGTSGAFVPYQFNLQDTSECACQAACRIPFECGAWLLCRSEDLRKDCSRAMPFQDSFKGVDCTGVTAPWKVVVTAPVVEFTSSLGGLDSNLFAKLTDVYIAAVQMAITGVPTQVDVTNVVNSTGTASGRRILAALPGVDVGTRMTFLGDAKNAEVQSQVRRFESTTLPTLNGFIKKLLNLTAAVQVQKTRTTETQVAISRAPPPGSPTRPPPPPPPAKAAPSVLLSKGRTTRSSQPQSAPLGAALVVDGKATTCMQTKTVPKPWLVVDLGSPKALSRVVVSNRPASDKLAPKLHDLEARAWNSTPTMIQPSTTSKSISCGFRKPAVPGGGSHTFQCGTPTAGVVARYVSLQITAAAAETLAPCEVSIYSPGKQ